MDQKKTYIGLGIVALGIALLLDIKYKGLVYQFFAPKKVYSQNK